MPPSRIARLARPLSPTLLCAVAVQAATVIIWATSLDARVSAIEAARAQEASVPERLARLEERVDAVREDVAFIRRAIERAR